MLTERSQSRPLSPAWTRRAWLATVVEGLGGWRVRAQQLPPGVGVAAAPPCDPATTPTPARQVDRYQPGAPLDARVTGGEILSVAGTVSGVRCGLIAGATVEWWHAVGAGIRRGRATTDRDGRYQFETVMPTGRAGAAPRINVRVLVPGKTVFTTVAFLPAAVAGAANANDRAFDSRLAMTLLDRRGSRVSAAFNVILDL